MLAIKFQDIVRATLAEHCGNRGWIGVSPKGDEYHVVVPVDAQIARGVMACNRPTDGTPFGGYSGWLYLMCEPYDAYESDRPEMNVRNSKASENARTLVKWLASYDVPAEVLGAPEKTGDE